MTIVLVAGAPLVHWLSVGVAPAAGAAEPKAIGAAKAKPSPVAPPPVVRGPDAALPRAVDEMRDAILTAVRSGNIEELRNAFELNEMKPDLGAGFGPGAMTDPVAYWRKISGDGEGREILAALGEILEMGHVVLPLGADVENNKVYVWPYLAELPTALLTPAQQVDLLRLVPPAEAKAMQAANAYRHWRLTIGADGTWHSFTRGP